MSFFIFYLEQFRMCQIMVDLCTKEKQAESRNPNADCGSHHYTSSEEERDTLVSLGWNWEGIGWFGSEQ